MVPHLHGRLQLRFVLFAQEPEAGHRRTVRRTTFSSSPAASSTGIPISGLNRYTVAAKSPLTDGFGESEAGGLLGARAEVRRLRRRHRARARRQARLPVDQGRGGRDQATPAGLWGLDNRQTLEHPEAGGGATSGSRGPSIGPAGERLVRYACVQNDLEHFNGRTGMGAVMGSKNLKAIAVRGTQKMQMADHRRRSRRSPAGTTRASRPTRRTSG